MRTPSTKDFEILSDLLSSNRLTLNYDWATPVDYMQLKRLLIKKGELNRALLKEVEANSTYQWLLGQNSTYVTDRNCTVPYGYKNAALEAIGLPNNNRWGVDWAEEMSRWVLDVAIGPIEKYSNQENPREVRENYFHELTIRVMYQDMDCWLTHFIYSIRDFLFPYKNIQEKKLDKNIKEKQYVKTIKLIENLLEDLDSNDEEYWGRMLNATGNEMIAVDCKNDLLVLRESIFIKLGFLDMDSFRQGYGREKASNTAQIRRFLRSIWLWLNDAGLGSKPKVLNNLLAMPIIESDSESSLISSRAVEALIQKLKAEVNESVKGVPIYRAWGTGPFGFATDSEFQLRMMDTSLYRS